MPKSRNSSPARPNSCSVDLNWNVDVNDGKMQVQEKKEVRNLPSRGVPGPDLGW